MVDNAMVFFYEAADGPVQAVPGPEGMSLSDINHLIRTVAQAQHRDPKPSFEDIYIHQNTFQTIRPTRPVSGYIRVRDRNYAPDRPANAMEAKWSLDAMKNVYWILDPARFDDLGINAVRALRNAIHRRQNPKMEPELAPVPDDKIDLLTDIITRPLSMGQKGRLIPDPEQYALLFHVMRLGATTSTCNTTLLHSFKSPSVMQEIRFKATCVYIFDHNISSWNWDGPAMRKPYTLRVTP